MGTSSISEPMCCAALAPQQLCRAPGRAPIPPCLSPHRAPRAAGHPGDPPEVQEHGAGAVEARGEQSPLHLHAGAQAGRYVGLPPIPWEPQQERWAHTGTPSQDKSAQCPCCPLGLGGVLGQGWGTGAAPALPSPHLAPPPAGEHEWKIVSTGIADCYFNVTELPPGSAAKFRVACVNKAGQGPYSTPSGKVHLEAAGERAPSCEVWGSRGASCGAVASGMLWGSLSPRGSSPQGFGEQGTACTPLLAYAHLAHTSLCSPQMPELPQPRTSLSPSPSPRRWLPAGRPRHPWGSWSRRPWGSPSPRRPASTREWCRRQMGLRRQTSPRGSSSPLRPARRGHGRTPSSHPTSLSACPPS